MSLAAAEQPDPLLPKPDPLAPKPTVPATPKPAAPAAPAPVEKAASRKILLAPPDDAAQAGALETLRDEYKDDYGKRRPADRQALGVALLEHGRRPKMEPAVRFVALREAEDLASKCGDVDTALAATEALCTWFAIPPREETARALSAARRVSCGTPA